MTSFFLHLNMDYLKITIHINPFIEWLRDILTAELGEIGYESFVEAEDGMDAYIPEENYSKKQLKQILEKSHGNFSVSWNKKIIKDKNWNEEWEKNYYKPVIIGNDCLIRAPFHTEYKKCRYEIIIEPNMSFGTGNHETTIMMVETILEANLKGKKVLDMGCGTGILSILASKLGAYECTAIDINERAFESVKKNMVLNKTTNISPKLGNALILTDEKFDFIFANIQKNILLKDMQAYKKALKNNGTLIMSGFYIHDYPDIKAKAKKLGLSEKGFKENNSWGAGIFTK